MDLTDSLIRARGLGDRGIESLLPAVYDELKRLAAGYLRSEREAHTLQPTALVHEAYLRLVDTTRANYADRDHFVRVAARAMRRILVDHARRRAALKRDPDGVGPPAEVDREPVDFLAVDEALSALSARSERQARVVELRYFAGLSVEEAARVLGIAERTVKNDWAVASAFLRRFWAQASRGA